MQRSDGRFDSVLSLRRACGDPTTEVASNDDTAGGNNAFLRRVLDPGDYTVLLDQFGPTTGTGGAYTLDVRRRGRPLTPPPGGGGRVVSRGAGRGGHGDSAV